MYPLTFILYFISRYSSSGYHTVGVNENRKEINSRQPSPPHFYHTTYAHLTCFFIEWDSETWLSLSENNLGIIIRSIGFSYVSLVESFVGTGKIWLEKGMGMNEKSDRIISFSGEYIQCWASLVAQTVKSLPEVQQTWVWSLSREDPLEREMATHSSTLAWKTPWMEEPGGLQSSVAKSMTWLSDLTA